MFISYLKWTFSWNLLSIFYIWTPCTVTGIFQASNLRNKKTEKTEKTVSIVQQRKKNYACFEM